MIRPQHEATAAQRQIATKSPYSFTNLVSRNRFAIADEIELLQLPENFDEVNRRAFGRGAK